MSLIIDLVTLRVDRLEPAVTALVNAGLTAAAPQPLPRELALALGRAELDQARCVGLGGGDAPALRLIEAKAAAAAQSAWESVGIAVSPRPASAVDLATAQPVRLLDEPGVAAGRICWLQLRVSRIARSLGYYEGLGARDAGRTDSGHLLWLGAGQQIQLLGSGPAATPQAASASLISVRFGSPAAAAESTLMQPCRVLAGPEGECIELL